MDALTLAYLNRIKHQHYVAMLAEPAWIGLISGSNLALIRMAAKIQDSRQASFDD